MKTPAAPPETAPERPETLTEPDPWPDYEWHRELARDDG